MGQLDGKVAIVTGGGNGLGRACAVRFAAEGAAVVVADLQNDACEETVGLIAEAGGLASQVHLDATNRLDNAEMAKHAVDVYGGINILVTAAGISHANYNSGDIEADVKMLTSALEHAEEQHLAVIDLDIDDFRKVIAVNVDGTLLAVQACLPAMTESGNGGSIVTIASVAAKHPDAGPLPYVTSKAAVWMLTKKLARMLASAKIRVNSIGPGYIETNMTAMFSMLPEDRKEEFFSNIPMGRQGNPSEIAAAALFLVSEESSYFTGEILHPDGGYFTE